MLRGNPTLTFNYLIRQLPSATAFINKKFEVVFVSDKWINDFDFDKTNVFGKSIHDLFGEISDEWKEVLDKCLNGETSEKGISAPHRQRQERILVRVAEHTLV